jgi:signal transduction histidine kinase
MVAADFLQVAMLAWPPMPRSHTGSAASPPSAVVEDTATEVAVRVTDRGREIARESSARTFDAFTRLAPNDGRAPPGLGLGLAIVRRIVELPSGSVAARSGALIVVASAS